MRKEAGARLVVGLGGNISDQGILDLVDAGADEFYVGYVPDLWHRPFGFAVSPNRRSFESASLKNPSDLARVVSLAQTASKSISLALNELQYTNRTRQLAMQILSEALEAGVEAVIVSEPDLLLQIRRRYPSLSIYASGELGVYNVPAVEQLSDWGVSRVILPRYLSLDEVKRLSRAAANKRMQVEAFFVAERCAFEGAYCFPSHGFLANNLCSELIDPTKVLFSQGTDMKEFQAFLQDNIGSFQKWKSREEKGCEKAGGECGLCAGQIMIAAGVTHFKIVGRGADIEALRIRTELARQALNYSGPDYVQNCLRLMDSPEMCRLGYKCYYRS